jgi:integrase
MSTLQEFLTFEHESEHVLEHDLSNNKLFSAPKIYNANGNLSKRWYVYFSFRNPSTGKLERMQNIYGKTNVYKTKEDRLVILSSYRRNLLKLLKEGYDPFKDNTALFQKSKEMANNSIVEPTQTERLRNNKKEISETVIETPKMTLREAFNFGLKLKEKAVNPRTLEAYTQKANILIKWVSKNRPKIKTIDQLDKKTVLDFLNTILIKSSPRNRNNYRVEISSIMEILEENDIMTINLMKKIKVLKTKPERNKTYSLEMQENIFSYLETKDPILLLYIKFVSYNFLRPIEVSRLKIKDINLLTKTIQFKAKNSPLKTKIIPKILLAELPDLSKLDKELLLFTRHKIGGEWEATENNRRDYFSKRFKTVVKEHFNLNKDYGLYSFRHTFITKLYRSLANNVSPFEARSNLMLITGHKSMSALEKYLRDIDAELPKDYSELLK